MSTDFHDALETRDPAQREAGDQSRAVTRLEFLKAGAIDQPGDDLANVVGLARVCRNHTP